MRRNGLGSGGSVGRAQAVTPPSSWRLLRVGKSSSSSACCTRCDGNPCRTSRCASTMYGFAFRGRQTRGRSSSPPSCPAASRAPQEKATRSVFASPSWPARAIRIQQPETAGFWGSPSIESSSLRLSPQERSHGSCERFGDFRGGTFLKPRAERQERLAVAPRRAPPEPLVVAHLEVAALGQRHDEADAGLDVAGVVEVVGGAGAEAVVRLRWRVVVQTADERRRPLE